MIRISLIRHAEPYFEDEDEKAIFLGARTDYPVGPEGTIQADELYHHFISDPFGMVWHSGLLRTRSTSQIVSDFPFTAIQVEPRIREIDMGLWDGLSKAEVMELYPQEYKEREAIRESPAFFELPFPEGESFLDLQKRAVEGLLNIVQIAQEGGVDHILVVGHKSVNRVILCHFLGFDLRQMFTFKQDYCAINVLQAGISDDGTTSITVEKTAE